MKIFSEEEAGAISRPLSAELVPKRTCAFLPASTILQC